MALFNPVYALVFPFLFLFTIPLALFATLTTILAFSVLLFRAILIYIELALAVIPYYLGQSITLPPILKPAEIQPPLQPIPRRRNRRSSSISILSAGSITPIPNDSILGYSQSVGLTRDFEGVGGWRLGDAEDDDDQWTNINSQLTLPADSKRRHKRSGSVSQTPNSSRVRARTPPSPVFMHAEAPGYFPNSGLMMASGSSGSSRSSGLSMTTR